MDATTASIVVAGSTLFGVLLTLIVGNQQRNHDERVQARRDEQAQREVRAYRNHDRRAQAAGDYIASLNAFRRGVKDLNEKEREQRETVQALARASGDAAALADLYFSETVHDLSETAAGIVADMHDARREGALKGDIMRGRDDEAKTAIGNLINGMKSELGESRDRG